MHAMEIHKEETREAINSFEAMTEYLLNDDSAQKSNSGSNMVGTYDHQRRLIFEGVTTAEVRNLLERKKHRRMIRNRESASRSRARKLAYITQLECEISQLKKENELLRKEKVLELLPAKAAKAPDQAIIQLIRRVSSAQF